MKVKYEKTLDLQVWTLYTVPAYQLSWDETFVRQSGHPDIRQTQFRTAQFKVLQFPLKVFKVLNGVA